jgi:hypothetical protein
MALVLDGIMAIAGILPKRFWRQNNEYLIRSTWKEERCREYLVFPEYLFFDGILSASGSSTLVQDKQKK